MFTLQFLILALSFSELYRAEKKHLVHLTTEKSSQGKAMTQMLI